MSVSGKGRLVERSCGEALVKLKGILMRLVRRLSTLLICADYGNFTS